MSRHILRAGVRTGLRIGLGTALGTGLGTAIRCATVLLGGTFFVAQYAAAQAARHPITFDDLIHMHRVGGAAISPDGAWVAYAVSTPDMDANRNASNIWIVRTSGGDAVQLTQRRT